MKETEKSKKKGFFARLLDKLDKKMAEKAKSKPCCRGNDDSKEKRCCGK
ncbi:MAG: hypothetical protein ABH858_07255 [Candidatus Omnitrophota bacterium]